MTNKVIWAKRILPLIDLTSLNDNDDDEVIKKLCKQALTPQGEVAAVCVYSKFVELAKKCLLGSKVKIATVTNFPSGAQDLDAILRMTKTAIEDGANEIDVVIPYQDYLSGNINSTKEIIRKSKNICGHTITLKVILETGVLMKPELIAAASRDAIASGADFLKTSTGKAPIGATIKAAEVMLLAICEAQKSGHKVGFKASGGIRTVEQAAEYLQLADKIMGPKWVAPNTFRFGASSLLNDVLGIAAKENGY